MKGAGLRIAALDHLVLTASDLDGSLDEAMGHVRSSGVQVLEGPVPHTGARGTIDSFHFRDPDEYLVEVPSYGGAP